MSGALGNSGTISATAEANYYAYAAGLTIAEDLTGPLNNSGRISATASAHANHASATALWVVGDVSGNLTNSGHIAASATADNNASAYGVKINGELSARLANTGSITATASANYWAYASALHLGSVSSTGEVNNSGTIAATLQSEWSSASGYAVYVSNDFAGKFTNTGRIQVSASVDDWAGIYGLYVGGQFTGALHNSGSIRADAVSGDSDASAYAVWLESGMGATGSVVNTGTISATAHGRDGGSATALRLRGGWFTSTLNSNWVYGAMGGSAQIVNSGLIEGVATGVTDEAYGWGIWLSADMYDNARILNKSSGVIRAVANSRRDDATATALYTGFLYGNASIVNQGLISAEAVSLRSEAYAIAVEVGYLYDNARLVNTGRIVASAQGATSASAYGIKAGYLYDSAAITNSGSITVSAVSPADSEAYAYGIYTRDLNDDARIVNSGTIRVHAQGDSSATAYGIETAYLYGNASILNTGTITVSALDRTSSAEAYGIYANSLHDSATLTNRGTISVTATGAGGDASAEAYGIYTYSLHDDAVVSNSGVIRAHAVAAGYSADAYGIDVGYLYGNARVSNSGLIDVSARAAIEEGYAIGIESDGVYDDAGIANSGTIRVYAEGSTSATAYGIAAWNGLYSNATLTNSGSISVTAVNHHDSSAEAYGIYANVLIDNASLTNSGLVMARAFDNIRSAGGSQANAYGVLTYYVDSGASITNGGTIIAQAESLNGDAYAYGIFAGTLDGTIENTGTLIATANGALTVSAYGVYAWGGSGQVINKGTIVGGVSLNGSVSLENSGKLVLSEPSYVGGDFTQLAKGDTTLVLGRNGGGLYVNGTADFTGSNLVRIAVAPGAGLQDGDVLSDVLYANTLVAPSDLNVKDMSVFWNFDVIDTGNGFDLEVKKVDPAAALAGIGLSMSSSQAGLVSAALNGNLGGDYSAFADALSMASTATQAASVLEQVGPALAGAAAQATRVAGAGASNAISARMGETRGAASGDAFKQNGVWLKPFLGVAEQDAANGVSGYDVDSMGYVIGVDGDVNDALRVGVAVASARSDVEGGLATLDIDTTQFTVYGSYAMGNGLTLDADLSYGVNRYDSSRRIGFAGSRATADYDGNQLGLGLVLGKRIALGNDAALTPSLTLRWTQVELDGYSESGAGAFNLTVADADEDNLLALAKVDYERRMGPGTFLASLGLGTDTADAASATARLGGTGPTFVNNGIDPESTLVTAGLGYRYVTAKNLEINAAWDVENRSDFLGNTLSVKFRLPF